MIIKYIQLYKYVLLASFFSALTIISIKLFVKYTNIYFLLLVALSDIALVYSYFNMLQKGDIFTEFSLVKIISILILLFPSIMYFDVELTNNKIIGLIFAFVAIYLLS